MCVSSSEVEEEEEEEEEEASSVGDSAPAEWPEDHEPLFTAEEPATVEGTAVSQLYASCVCVCVCQKREVRWRRRRSGWLQWRKGSWMRQAMFLADQALHSLLDRYIT